MALQPPPTFANPIDPSTGTFSPVWLQWFLDYAGLANSNGTQTSTIVAEIATLNSEVGTLTADVTAALNFTQGYTHPPFTSSLSTGGSYVNGTSYNLMVIVPTAGVTGITLKRGGATYISLAVIPSGFTTFTLSPSDSITLTMSSGAATLTLTPV